jgi:hypothetical protein
MKVQELFESAPSIGTINVAKAGDGFAVTASAKSGPVVQGIFHVWKQFVGKKGVKITMKSGKELGKMDGLKILDNRPQGLLFYGVEQQALEDAAKKAVAKIEKEQASKTKYKADAPKRKAEASKFASEQRKKDMAEYDAKYGKGTWKRVTYKQEGGDDGYSYVVRVDGRAKWNGLSQREAMSYKQREVDEIAKKEKLGKYAEKQD